MSPTRDWDAELKKIDRQINSIPDEALVPEKAPPQPSGKAAAVVSMPASAAEPRTTRTLHVVARLALALIAAVSIVFWPYPTLCGTGLFGYLAATTVVAIGGLWASVWTWRHRSGKMHTLSLLVALWGGVLTAREVLPRIGYAIPNEAHPATWWCK
jgi:hypothetical protein